MAFDVAVLAYKWVEILYFYRCDEKMRSPEKEMLIVHSE